MRDIEKKREYMRAYNRLPEHKAAVARSKEKWAKEHGMDYDRAYYLKHKDRINTYNLAYRQGKISHTVYRLDVGGYTYIGSTIYFEKRISRHQTNLKDGQTPLLYTLIEQYGWESVHVSVIMRDISTRLERLVREQEEIDKIPPEQRLNTRRAVSKKKMDAYYDSLA